MKNFKNLFLFIISFFTVFVVCSCSKIEEGFDPSTRVTIKLLDSKGDDVLQESYVVYIFKHYDTETKKDKSLINEFVRNSMATFKNLNIYFEGKDKATFFFVIYQNIGQIDEKVIKVQVKEIERGAKETYIIKSDK